MGWRRWRGSSEAERAQGEVLRVLHPSTRAMKSGSGIFVVVLKIIDIIASKGAMSPPLGLK